jgi:hypothetical protein
MADICECCELPLASCGRAAEKRQQAELAEWHRYLIRHGWFASRFPGSCRKCGTAFKPGVLIFTRNRSAPYLAECCAPEAPQ